MSRRTALLLLSVIMTAAIVLRTYRITDRSFWFDEAFSYTLTEEFSWLEMLDRIGRDVHPPLYYMVLRLWEGLFGTSLLALRGMSAFFGVATVLAVYVCCRDAFCDRDWSEVSLRDSRGMGVIAAALVAAGSAHIHWSHETRMYTLATTLAVLSTWCLLRALRNPPRAAWWWAAYSILAACFLYTHNYSLFSVFAQGCFVVAFFLWEYRRQWRGLWQSRAWWQAVTALCAALWLYLPWFGILLQQKRRVQADYWIPDVGLWTIPDALALLFVPHNSPSVSTRWETAVVVATLAICLTLLLRHARWTNWLVLCMVLMPIACATTVSLISVSVIVPRHFLYAQMFVFCAAGYVLWSAFSGAVRWISVGLLLFNMLYVHAAYWGELRYWDKPGVQGAVEYLLAEAGPEEPIIVVHPCIYYSVKYYTRGRAQPLLFIGEVAPNHFHGGPLLVPGDVIQQEQLAGLPQQRIWVVDTTGFSARFNRPFMPSPWTSEGRSRSFEDVYFFQGSISVSAFSRQGAELAGG